jgi:hypothetical protein
VSINQMMSIAGGLILLYLLLNSRQAGQVIGSLAAGVGGLFGVLQGRAVQFPGGVGITGGLG